jgi:hypothetical protein
VTPTNPQHASDPEHPRNRCVRLLASQFATADGHIFNRLDGKKKILFLTRAENALAIVERIARNVDWSY